jgi:probable HAF family extracellular repeat protein
VAAPVATPDPGPRDVRYAVVDLGVLAGGDSSVATSVNARGVAAGSSVSTTSDETSLSRAVVFRGGQVTALAGDGLVGSSSANAINGPGDCAGSSVGGSGLFRAMLWVDGAPVGLPSLGGQQSMAFGVNDDGIVVGWAQPAAPAIEPRACRWEDGTATDLGTLGQGIRSVAYGINAAGAVVGASTTELDDTQPAAEHAVLWLRGGTVDLGTIAGNYSAASAINEGGQIVGVSTTGRRQRPFGPGTHATLWEGGNTPMDLGTLGTGERSQATAINAAGLIVGSSATSEELPNGEVGQEHACLWEAGGTTPRAQDLNRMIPAGTGWVLERANGINDAGQIVGVGYLAGQPRAFLLEPTVNG